MVAVGKIQFLYSLSLTSSLSSRRFHILLASADQVEKCPLSSGDNCWWSPNIFHLRLLPGGDSWPSTIGPIRPIRPSMYNAPEIPEIKNRKSEIRNQNPSCPTPGVWPLSCLFHRHVRTPYFVLLRINFSEYRVAESNVLDEYACRSNKQHSTA